MRRVDRDGTITTVAGVPVERQPSTPTTTATAAPPRTRSSASRNDAPLAVAPDGTIYVVDSQDRIRRIGTDGIIDTYAGGGQDATQNQDLGDGERALDHDFGAITGMTVGFDGSLYVADRDEFRILRIRPDGRLQRVAGNGTEHDRPRRPGARSRASARPLDVAENREGELIVRTRVPATANGSDGAAADDQHRGRHGPDSPARSTARSATRARSSGSRTAARRATPASSSTRRAAASRSPATATRSIMQSRYWIYRASGPYKDSPGSALVASPDGRDVYAFDGAGRHTRTLDALTGAVEEQFSYAGGALAAIKDADDRETTILRDAGGLPTGIRRARGARDHVRDLRERAAEGRDQPGRRALRDDVRRRAACSTTFERDGGATSSFTYDELGRLKTAESPGGRELTLTRAETSTSSRGHRRRPPPAARSSTSATSTTRASAGARSPTPAARRRP